MKVEYKELKTFNIRENNRSSNFIAPSFSNGCYSQCVYCYARRHNPDGFSTIKVSTNIDSILEKIKKHSSKLGIKTPDQVDNKYWVYEISMNSDFSNDSKFLDWVKIFDFFVENNIKLTFATKNWNKDFLNYSFKNNHRIRYSVMPSNVSKILEPKTLSIEKRIECANKLFEKGINLQWNFSPIFVYKGWKEDYVQLFRQIKENSSKNLLDNTACEVIFGTQNKSLNEWNAKNGIDDSFIWKPELLEEKKSEYGGTNLRYKWQLKAKWIEEFKQLLKQELDIPIRYIF